MLAHWSGSPLLSTHAGTLSAGQVSPALQSPLLSPTADQRPRLHRRGCSSSAEANLDVLRILRREWRPCTSGQRLAVFMSQEKNGPFLRSLCSHWRRLSSPPLEVIAELREMRVIDQASDLDLAAISLQQEQTIAMFIQHALNPTSEAIVPEPFHTFAAQVGLFSMVKAELLAIENGIPAYERPALYEQVWRDLLDDFAEAKERSCNRLGDHACLGKIVWGEAYGWSATQLKEAYMEYALQLEQGVPSPAAGPSTLNARNRTVSSSASESPEATFTNTPSASSSMTSPYVSPNQTDAVAALNCDIEADFNANVKAALQTLYSIEEANAVVENTAFVDSAAALSASGVETHVESQQQAKAEYVPMPTSVPLGRRPTWMNFWEQAQAGANTTDYPVTSLPLSNATQGLNLDLNSAIDLSALMAAPLVDPAASSISVLGAAFPSEDCDTFQGVMSGYVTPLGDGQSSPVEPINPMKRKAIDGGAAHDFNATAMPIGRSKRHYTRSKAQRRLLQDVSLRMRTLARQLNAHASDSKVTEAMSFAMSGKTATSQWADLQHVEVSSPSAVLDDNERKRLSKQRLRKRDLETTAKLAGMANIIVETPLGKIKSNLTSVQRALANSTAAQRRHEAVVGRENAEWPLHATLQAWMEFQDDWDDLVATERRLLPNIVPNGRSIDTMVQLLRLAISTTA